MYSGEEVGEKNASRLDSISLIYAFIRNYIKRDHCVFKVNVHNVISY